MAYQRYFITEEGVEYIMQYLLGLANKNVNAEQNVDPFDTVRTFVGWCYNKCTVVFLILSSILYRQDNISLHKESLQDVWLPLPTTPCEHHAICSVLNLAAFITYAITFGTSVCQAKIGAIWGKYTLVSITFPIDLMKPCQFGFGEILFSELLYNVLVKH